MWCSSQILNVHSTINVNYWNNASCWCLFQEGVWEKRRNWMTWISGWCPSLVLITPSSVVQTAVLVTHCKLMSKCYLRQVFLFRIEILWILIIFTLILVRFSFLEIVNDYLSIICAINTHYTEYLGGGQPQSSFWVISLPWNIII